MTSFELARTVVNCNQNCDHALAAPPPASEQIAEQKAAALHSFSAAGARQPDRR